MMSGLDVEMLMLSITVVQSCKNNDKPTPLLETVIFQNPKVGGRRTR